ncbi:hypothetical protein C8R14_14712 [Nitrosomonas eutropha]|uniref:Uncharacterized protein n=1 Tax=Nitrosomonas eutropha TaxID=916 RepID=A0ABX5M4D8_9PROT|nr:hypothetical protein C8R14_14712 [Nitrosomonas eutropha]SEJ30166.1 hypothetical protein SAMN05216318_1444 [Nitrosomonas eutropha]
MKLLLDTHLLLWVAANGFDYLPRTAQLRDCKICCVSARAFIPCEGFP